MALLIEAAFSRYEAGVGQTGIIEAAVPSASPSPAAPGDV